MEVKIGVADSPREVVVVSDQTPDEVEKLVRAALNGADDGVLALVDEKGRKVLVQAAKISYVDIGPATLGKVASPPTESDRRERAGACRPGPFVVLGMCRQRRRRLCRQRRRSSGCSGTCFRPPQASATVVSTASSLGIGRAASSQ